MGLQILKELYGVVMCVQSHSQRRALRGRKENGRGQQFVNLCRFIRSFIMFAAFRKKTSSC